ncbi:MAG: hypothetical protein HOP15_04835 [Planctomycetes bacterium]|nr:hypothetical protein [Planctomycetota bacterium]
MRLLPLAALLLATELVAAQAELPGGVRDANALYPCAPSAAVVRFFHLETDEPELAKINPALAELGAELAYGPRTTQGRPGHAFVALRAPPEVSPKKLAAALKKGGGPAEELVCIAFDGREGKDHDFGLADMGITKRDFVMGISGDIVWYDALGKWSQFYGRPGKLKAQELLDRYAKLFAPYGGAKLGAVVKERFSWTLASAPDEKTRARVLKTLEKTAGVEGAALEENVLTVTLWLDRLETCGAVGKLTGAGEALDEAVPSSPRAAFDTAPLYALLQAEKLVP